MNRHQNKVDPVSEELIEADLNSCWNLSRERVRMPTPSLQRPAAEPIAFEKLEVMIAERIAAAARHTRTVARREHIMADRVERVNHFITDLRRELGQIERHFPSEWRNSLIGAITQKALWYDCGQLNPTFATYNVSISRDAISRWVAMASRLSLTTDAAKDEIESDLKELKRGLNGMFNAVEDARRINNESEPILSGLVGLFDGVAEE